MKTENSARFQFILSMLIFGTVGPITRLIPISSGELSLYRAILASALILAYMFFKKDRISFSHIRHELPLLFLSGACIGINWILLFQAYRYTTVSVASLSYYFAPVIVTVVSPFLLKEQMTAKKWLCFIMSTIGLVLLIGISDFHASKSHIIGILFGLGAACFYAAVILLNKCIKKVEGIHRTLLQFLSAIILLIPYTAVTGGFHFTSLKGIGLICLLIIGFIHTGITYCMYFSSMKDLKGQQVSILSYIDPLTALLISVFILGESITPLQLLGGILILGFTLYNEIS